MTPDSNLTETLAKSFQDACLCYVQIILQDISVPSSNLAVYIMFIISPWRVRPYSPKENFGKKSKHKVKFYNLHNMRY